MRSYSSQILAKVLNFANQAGNSIACLLLMLDYDEDHQKHELTVSPYYPVTLDIILSVPFSTTETGQTRMRLDMDSSETRISNTFIMFQPKSNHLVFADR